MNDLEMALQERLSRAIHERVFPGCIVGIVRKEGNQFKRLIVPCGHLNYLHAAEPVDEGTIYDVASITKVLPTASALLSLVDTGDVTLDAHAFPYLPRAFDTGKDKRGITVRHLLTYTVDLDLPPLASMVDADPNDIIYTVLSAPVKNPPGSKLVYTNATAILMGMIVESIVGKKLSRFAEDYFFRRLEMNHTSYSPLQKFSRDTVAPTEWDDARGRFMWGEVHDESARTLARFGAVGSAGIFSSVPDLLIFLEVLLRGGVGQDGFRYFTPETVCAMHTNHLALIGSSGGLGWELNQRWMGERRSSQTFGKTGFTGCSVLCDPERGVGAVLLSNHIHPTRHETRDAISALRRDVADMVFRVVDNIA